MTYVQRRHLSQKVQVIFRTWSDLHQGKKFLWTLKEKSYWNQCIPISLLYIKSLIAIRSCPNKQEQYENLAQFFQRFRKIQQKISSNRQQWIIENIFMILRSREDIEIHPSPSTVEEMYDMIPLLKEMFEEREGLCFFNGKKVWKIYGKSDMKVVRKL